MNSLNELVASLQKMFAGARTDCYGNFFDKTPTEAKRYLTVKSPVTTAVLHKHLENKQPIGQYLMLAGAATSTVAAFDIDDHAGTVAWDEMVRHTKNLCDGLKCRGLRPFVFRSGGGKGTHIFCVWKEPQDAASIIAIFDEILAEYGLKKGDGGVTKGSVEIFPKQASVPKDQMGNLIAVPLARQSVALSDGDLKVMPKEQFCFTEAHYSPAIQNAAPDRNTLRETSKIRADYDVVRSALNVIPADDYSLWVRILLCLKGAVEADILTEEQGEQLYSEWSGRSEKHNPQRDDALWQRMRPTGNITFGTLFWCAKQHGWVAPVTSQVPVEIEWDEPIDFRRSATPSPGFPKDFLPGAFGDFARDIAHRMSVPLEFAAIPLLIAFATVFGRAVVLQPKKHDATWVECACLWGMIVSEPGTKKSPSMKEATRPLALIQKRFDAIYQRDIAQYEKDFAAYKKDNDANPRPTKPKERYVIVNDATVEALCQTMGEHDIDMLMLCDELAKFLLSMNQYKGKGGDKGFYLQCWSGGAHTIIRKTAANISLSDLYLSIYGAIQPEVARTLFSDTSDGFTARFGLMAYPDNQVVEFVDEPHDEKAEKAVIASFNAALRIFHGIIQQTGGYDDETSL